MSLMILRSITRLEILSSTKRNLVFRVSLIHLDRMTAIQLLHLEILTLSILKSARANFITCKRKSRFRTLLKEQILKLTGKSSMRIPFYSGLIFFPARVQAASVEHIGLISKTLITGTTLRSILSI